MTTKVEEGILDIDGVGLEYQWIGGPAEGEPTLVFLHEGLGCVALWRDFPARVVEATGCAALVYSRVGYGRSDPVAVPRPLTYMHTEGLEVLPKVLDAAGVHQAVLVGHSDGGSIALINAGGVQDSRVVGLVLMAAHVFNEQVCVDSIRAAKEAYRGTDLRVRLARFHGGNVDCAFWGWNHAWLDPGFWHWNIEEYLPGVEVPVLAIQGEDDEYGTRRQVERIEHQVAGPVRTLLLPRCRHAAYRDQPEATLAAMVEFVAELRARAAVAHAQESSLDCRL